MSSKTKSTRTIYQKQEWKLSDYQRTEIEEVVLKIKDKYKDQLTEVEIKKIIDWSWDKVYEKLTDNRTVSIRYPKFGIFAINYYRLQAVFESLDDKLAYCSHQFSDFIYNKMSKKLETLRPIFKKCQIITKTNEFKIYHKKYPRYSGRR